MGNNIFLVGEDGIRPQEKKQEQRPRRRHRGSGKNKKKIQDEAVKKFKEDAAKKQKGMVQMLKYLAIWGLPVGLVVWFVLNQAVHAVTQLVAQWATAMAALLK